MPLSGKPPIRDSLTDKFASSDLLLSYFLLLFSLQTFRTLENLTSTVLCNSSEVPSGLMKDKAVVVMRGNCTFLEKARIAQRSGAKMLLIASKARLVSYNL